MSRLILCQYCQRKIESRDDLVTSLMIFTLAPFHAACYTRALKGWHTIVLSNDPVHSVSGNIMVAVSLLMAIIVLITREIPGAFLLVALLFPAVRLYSWLAYERHLEADL